MDTSPVWEHGFEALERFAVEYGKFQKTKVNVHLLLRGKREEVTTSLKEILRCSPLYAWRRHKPEEFRQKIGQILTCDTELLERVMNINDFCQERELVDEPAFVDLAILQMAAEIGRLAERYVPEMMISSEEEEEEKKQQSVTRAGERDGIFRSLFQKITDGIAGIKEASKAFLRSLTRPLSPFLQSHYCAGRDRRGGNNPYEGIWKNRSLFEVENPVRDSFFLATKIFNRYDPKTGDLSVDAQRSPLIYEVSNRANPLAITIPLSGREMASGAEVSIPVAFCASSREGQGRTRISDRQHYSIAAVEIRTNKGDLLLDSPSALPFLERDGLGNVTLTLTSSLKEELRTRRLVSIHIKYAPSVITEGNWYSQRPDAFMGPMPQEDWYEEVPFLPPKIAQIMESKLRQEQRDDVPAFIIGLLRNLWLRYSARDAPPHPSDPRGSTQFHRVLAQQRASCEGANVALMQMLRPLLRDGEGIAFMTGFRLDGSRRQSVAGRQYHASLLMRGNDENGGTVVQILDATPHSQRFHKLFRRRSQQRSRMQRAFHEPTQQFLAERRKAGIPVIDGSPESRQLLEELHERYDALWEHKRSQTIFIENIIERFDEHGVNAHTLIDYLPSYYGNCRHLIRGRSSSPHGVIDGHFSLALEPIKIYDPNLDEESLDAWHRDDRGITWWLFWKRYLRDRFMQAQRASLQNIHVVDTFMKPLEECTEHYRTEFQDMLSRELGDKISCPIKEFWAQACWMTLLPDPMDHLRGFFRRSSKSTTRGFLLPEAPDDISKNIETHLQDWKRVVGSRLQSMQHFLQNLPPVSAPLTQSIPFPALRFLRDTERLYDRGEEKLPPQIVTPEWLFDYLKEKLSD